ncbi:MAG: hypothetical protein WC378_03995 [Opitutaceae bacterium]|jgi:hypothetical protein
MEHPDLHARLLADAQGYDPAQHTRGLLAPFRDVLLLQRAKFMSYEQIAATLTRHGLKVSPAAVGCFCRRTFTKAEIESLRQKQEPKPAAAAGATPAGRTPVRAVMPVPREPGRRGPKIARDDF